MDPTYEDARTTMARLDARRVRPEIPWRDLGPYAAGNCGIPYVFRFDSARPGPNAVVTCLSHGNEPAGREAVIHLLDTGVRPVAGSLTLVFGNVAAHSASNGVDPYGRRFVDDDFNRVWSDALLDGPRQSVELARAREIRAVIAAADVLLDLHSTPYEAAPFFPLRPGPSRSRALAEAIGHPATLVFFEQGSVHTPTISRYGRLSQPEGSAVGITVECGLFFADAAVAVARSTIGRVLRHVGSIDDATAQRLITWFDPAPPRRILVTQPEPATTTDIQLHFTPESFHPYPAGAIVGYDGARPMRAPFDGAVPMWIKQTFVAGEQAFMWGRHL
jgi:predicted deacylase